MKFGLRVNPTRGTPWSKYWKLPTTVSRLTKSSLCSSCRLTFWVKWAVEPALFFEELLSLKRARSRALFLACPRFVGLLKRLTHLKTQVRFPVPCAHIRGGSSTGACSMAARPLREKPLARWVPPGAFQFWRRDSWRLRSRHREFIEFAVRSRDHADHLRAP